MDEKLFYSEKQNIRRKQTEAAKEYPLEEMVKTDGRVCEALAAYLPAKKQGEFTIEDLKNIPDERRVELIDGVIF